MDLERRPADPGRAAFFLSLLAVGALAAGLAWWRAPALIGLAHDDAEYVAYAQALAAGLGYVDPTALEPAPARRFPIGFPLLLAPLAGLGPAAAAAVGPIMLIAYTLLAGIAIRRWAAVPAWAAVALAGAIALSTEVLYLGSMVLSDLPCAVLILAGLLLAERAGSAWRGAAIGALFGAACLVRYAAVAPLGAAIALALLQRRPAAAVQLGAGGALIGLPWLAYRSWLGGSQYGNEFQAFLDLGANGPAAAGRLLANGLGGWIVPPAAEADLGLWAVAGAAAGLTAAYGAWRMRHEAPLPAAALVATAVLALIWGLAYVWTERPLMSRLLLPVAPAIWAAFVHGARALLAADPGVAAQAGRLGRAGLAGVAVATGAALWAGPGVPRAVHAAIATDYGALFAAVKQHVPPDERIMAPLPAMAWLYTGRRATGYPVVLAKGRDQAAGPEAFVATLADRRVGWVLAAPPLYAPSDGVALSLVPAMQARPGAFTPVWRSPRGDYALIRVEAAKTR